MSNCLAFAVIGLIVISRAAGAQPASAAQPTFRAEVSLVEVASLVTGEDDRSLTDLTASDFEVSEDGEPRELLSVPRLTTATSVVADRPPIAGIAAASVEQLATNVDVADAPVFVLLLDDLDTSPYDTHRMIRAAEGALAAIPPTALVAVATTSGVDGSPMTLARPGPDHLERIRGFRGQLLLRERVQTPGGTTPSAVNAPCGVGSGTMQSLDCGDPTRAARRAAAVGAVAEILGRAGSRRKVLFWLAVTMGVSPLDPEGSRRAQRAALRSALNNDVTVYVLDPRENPGTDNPTESRRTGGTMRVGAGDSAFGGGAGSVLTLDVDDLAAVPLTQITRETGGRYITMANDLDVMLGKLVEQNTTTYVLTYESPVARQPGRHRIDVKVRRPHARVHARRGYIVEASSAVGSRQDTAPLPPPEARLLRDTFLGSVSQGTLPITVQVVPRFATGRQGSAAITVRLDADVQQREPIDVLLATVDDEGRVANQRQVRMAPPPAGAPWEVAAELELPRGRHQVRVAAATADATRTGLVVTPVEIIEPGRDLVMTPPVLLATRDGRVHPTTVRRFAVGEPLGLQVEVGGRAVQQRTLTMAAVLVNAAGDSVRQAEVMRDPGTQPNRERATAIMATGGLAPGTYALLVEAREGSSTTVRQAVPIVLEEPAAPAAATGSAAVGHSVVARGPASGHDAPGTFVIRSVPEWQAFWDRLPTRQAAPDIDFARVTLLAVVSDQRGGEPIVDAVTQVSGDIVVRWRTRAASAQPAGPPVVGYPFVVVGMVGHRGSAIRFERLEPSTP